MDRQTRLLRTGILCQHALRHLAYLEAMKEHEAEWDRTDFWIATHNNFLDIGILEWCKLFTEAAGKHHWRQSVINHAAFEAAVLLATGMTEAEFSEYGDRLRHYRNRFLAHLDDDNVFRLPTMIAAINSTKCLLHWLLTHEDDCSAFPADHVQAEEFYALAFTHARALLRGEA